MDITWREFELIFASRVNQASWQSEQLSAKSLQCSRLPPLRQREAFEPVDQIVGQKDQMEIDLVGQEVVGRNLAQRKTFFEFPNVQFHPSPLFVEMPYRLRFQREIRDKDMIEIILEFPEGQLEFMLPTFRVWVGELR